MDVKDGKSASRSRTRISLIPRISDGPTVTPFNRTRTKPWHDSDKTKFGCLVLWIGLIKPAFSYLARIASSWSEACSSLCWFNLNHFDSLDRLCWIRYLNYFLFTNVLFIFVFTNVWSCTLSPWPWRLAGRWDNLFLRVCPLCEV